MAINLHKNVLEPNEVFTGCYRKGIEILDELQDTQNIVRWERQTNCGKNYSISVGLNSKIRLV